MYFMAVFSELWSDEKAIFNTLSKTFAYDVSTWTWSNGQTLVLEI